MPKIQVERQSSKPVDIFKVLNHYEIEYRKSPEDGYVQYKCPFHDDHNFGSTSMRVYDGLWYCFSCSLGGNLTMFVAKKEGISTGEAYKRILSDFTFADVYDEDTWKEHLETFAETDFVPFKYHQAVEEVTDKIVERLCGQRLPSDRVADWLGLCSWLNTPPIELNASFCDRGIFQLYEEFDAFMNTVQ